MTMNCWIIFLRFIVLSYDKAITRYATSVPQYRAKKNIEGIFCSNSRWLQRSLGCLAFWWKENYLATHQVVIKLADIAPKQMFPGSPLCCPGDWSWKCRCVFQTSWFLTDVLRFFQVRDISSVSQWNCAARNIDRMTHIFRWVPEILLIDICCSIISGFRRTVLVLIM